MFFLHSEEAMMEMKSILKPKRSTSFSSFVFHSDTSHTFLAHLITINLCVMRYCAD